MRSHCHSRTRATIQTALARRFVPPSAPHGSRSRFGVSSHHCPGNRPLLINHPQVSPAEVAVFLAGRAPSPAAGATNPAFFPPSRHFTTKTSPIITAMPSSPGEGQEERQQAISGEEWEDASPAQKIKWLLGPEGSKWGWVVYRTCYKPELDAPWEMLQRMIVANCKDEVGDDPEVLDKMDWRFVSDPTTLDGADRDQLREKFKTFVEGEDPGVVVVAKDGGLGTKGSRYEVFLEADEQALLSCLGMDSGKGGDYGAYVNIVRGWVDSRMMPPEDASAEEREEWDLDDWMRISVGMVGPASWVEMDNPENWYIYWAKPECGRVWAS